MEMDYDSYSSEGKWYYSPSLEIKVNGFLKVFVRTVPRISLSVSVSCSHWVDFIELHACDMLSKPIISTACQL